MRVVTVDSSTLATVAYDEARELLQLGFCTRGGLPILRRSCGSASGPARRTFQGQYFNQAIRDRFPYRLIADSVAVPPDTEVPAGCGC